MQHLDVFADCHDGANQRLVNLLAAAGGHDQPARRLLKAQPGWVSGSKYAQHWLQQSTSCAARQVAQRSSAEVQLTPDSSSGCTSNLSPSGAICIDQVDHLNS